jgi:hypothetical protein
VDTFLTIAFAVIQIVLVGMGIGVSVRPPKERRHIWGVAIMFVAFGAMAIVVSVWQSARASSTQERLQNELKASIANVPRSTAADFMKSGGNVTVMGKAKPWGLTQEQLATLTRRMAPFSSAENRSGLIDASMSDPESIKFGFGLVSAFRAANWVLPGSGMTRSLFTGPVVGIIVVVHSREADPPGLRDFILTLKEAGIEVSGEIDDKLPSERFRIVVGSRPED